MSIRVVKSEDDMIDLSNPDNPKSYTTHHATKIESIVRDFRGRVDDEREE